MEKTVMRRNEALLKKAQAVFGEDLVVNAFVCTWSHDFSSDEEVASRLEFSAQEAWGLPVDELSYDAATIRLVFCNGRTVEFNNSEWASMLVPGDEGREV